MSTILFNAPIFGPVRSRRLGVSLGVNLLPADRKICSFDCLYCECGFGRQSHLEPSLLPRREAVAEQLRAKLTQMSEQGERPDVITFAGNGEPTLHPDFAGIIADTIAIRNQLAPNAKVAVLSNASQLSRPDVAEALRQVDDNILKIDSGREATILQLDRPRFDYSLDTVVEQVAAFGSNLVVQTMFVKWEKDGIVHDNSEPADVEPWLDILGRIRPPRLMVYTIARETPLGTMSKVPAERLDAIAKRVGEMLPDIKIQVSY